jgi:hypothetical protein
MSSTTITHEQLVALFHEYQEQMHKDQEQMRKDREQMHKDQEQMRKDRALEMRKDRAQMRKYQKRAEKSHQEWQEREKRLNEKISKLGDRLGELIEAMVEGGIKRLFKNLGYEFEACNRRYEFSNKSLDIYGEVDLLIENGEFALLVEVKTNLTVSDVKKHVERLEKFRKHADYRNDKRRFIAAAGGGVVRKNVQEFAQKQGMFVVQQSGENVEVIPPKGKPRVW